MTQARSRQVNVQDTLYYHCITRCVRRAFLCGEDPVTGENYEHRKHWVVDKLKELSEVFAIDICAYAVLSNHYHLILHVDRSTANSWDQKEEKSIKSIGTRFLVGASYTYNSMAYTLPFRLTY